MHYSVHRNLHTDFGVFEENKLKAISKDFLSLSHKNTAEASYEASAVFSYLQIKLHVRILRLNSLPTLASAPTYKPFQALLFRFFL